MTSVRSGVGAGLINRPPCAVAVQSFTPVPLGSGLSKRSLSGEAGLRQEQRPGLVLT